MQKRCSKSCEVPPSFFLLTMTVMLHRFLITSQPSVLIYSYVPPIIVLFPVRELMSDNGLTVYS